MRKRFCLFLGFALILLLGGAEAAPHVLNVVKADLPPPRTTTGLKKIVEDLMDATPTADRVDTDQDGMYDKVEIVIGTDFNNSDSDFDLLDDYYEVQIDSDPSDPDTNSDGLSDYMEIANITNLDLDSDSITNIWDYDNDGDGVNDGVDLSPFSKSIIDDNFHFELNTNGKPTIITLQFKPKNPENLKLYAQAWNWPSDSKGLMKDLDNSLEDLKVVPQLNVTVNILPSKSDVADFGILVTDYGMHVPVHPIWENDDIVAFTAQIFYNSTNPLALVMDARLMWRGIGNTDEKANALQAYNGKYVTVGADGRLTANSTQITSLETFQWLEAGEEKVVLKIHGGPYLSVTDDGSITAGGSDIGPEQTFELVSINNATYLKAFNGKYLSVAPDGTILANSNSAGNPEAFQIVNRGCLSDWTILVTYQEPFMLTGFTVSESWGCDLGLFYNENKEQTIKANLLLGYDFLRNSTTHMQDMPSMLANYGTSILSSIQSFATQEEALVQMSNILLPNVLDSLPPNQSIPIILAVEEQQVLVEMSELSQSSYILSSSFSVDLSSSAQQIIVTKSLKTNFYETTGYKTLNLDDIMRDINSWQLSEAARFSLSTLVLAWNTGEQVVTKLGSQVVSWQPPEELVTTSTSLEYTLEGIGLLMNIGQGIWAYKTLQLLKIKGWNSASLARWLGTGGETGGFRLWAELVNKMNKAQNGWSGIKGLKTFQKIAKSLEILGVVIDIGMSILTGIMLATQIGGHLGTSLGVSFAIAATIYTVTYTVILVAIGEIPYVGPILVLVIAIADIFGGFSDWFTGLLMDWFGPDDLSVVEPWLEEIGIPKITIDDKDGNGFDVGDRVSITLTTKSKVNVTSGGEAKWAQYSWYRPYISINAPPGSFSNTSMSGIPPSSTWNVSSGTGWKTEEFETGAWIEPGIGMPNFPVSVKLNVDYKLYHVWEHFVFYLVYWEWCRHEDVNQGVSSSHLMTIYYDVLPENIDDFGRWRGVTPLDHDYDGLSDVNETSSDPYRYDTDADGLNDKFESTIGTDPWNFDTDSDGLIDYFEVVFGTDPTKKDSDGDGLPDYLEKSGWIIPFNYTGDPAKSFTIHVFSDPRVADTDGDGVDDYIEYWSDLNPRSSDTNGDGNADIGHPNFVETKLTFVRGLNITAPGYNLADIDVDADGNLYVLRNTAVQNVTSKIWTDTVFKFSPNGTFIDSWQTGGDTSFYSIAVDRENGYFYVARHGDIYKYNLNGTSLGRIEHVSYLYLRSIDVDADGYVYASSYQAYSSNVVGVLKFAPNGTFLEQWGSIGDGPDKFHDVGFIAVDDKNGYIYVTDYSTTRPNRITKFTKNGQYITSLPDGFGFPSGIDVDAEGYVYVTDQSKNRVQKFDSNGILIATWGRTGNEDGNFTNPFQITVDSNGYVYVADTSDTGGGIQEGPYPLGRVQKFSQTTEERTPIDDPVPDRDGDGLENILENTGWNTTFTNTTGTFTLHVTSDPLMNDTDFDGLSDYEEFNIGLNPMSPDTDSDGVSDFTEYQWHNSPGMNPAHYDTDGDGLEDGVELTFTSNPTKPDTDDDGLSDLEEYLLNSDPNDSDTDDDGLSDYQELQFGSSLTNPDSDGDFAFDGAELNEGTDPQSSDTDHDGLPDGHEIIYGTVPLKGDSDGDNLPDGFEIDNWLNPLNNDTDGDGLLDSTELEKGTNPLNGDSDFDGIPDGEDFDTNSTQIENLVICFDSNNATQEFAENLAQYTNVTVVSKEQLLANYTNSPYIVLVGRPDGNGTIGTFIHDLMLDSGDVLTEMIESDENRFAVRYGLWSPTQTVVMLSKSFPSDHLRTLEILRSKTITILPDSAAIHYNMSLAVHYAAGGSLNHTDISSNFLSIDEIDTVKATDSILQATLEESVNASIQLSRYNASTTPFSLTPASGLESFEKAVGKYLNITASENLQNTTSDIIDTAIIQIYYKEADLDKTGNSFVGDPDDLDENTLNLYFFDETSGIWIKLSHELDWVVDFGVNTTNIELYGETYAGYVWARVSHFSFYGLAGLTFNRPPDISDARPSQNNLWPVNKKLVPVTIEGVVDPDGDEITITVTGITSNETVKKQEVYGVGTDMAWLVADRLGKGNGRVYVISFVATDGKGGETAGSVEVYVPHDMKK